MRRDLRRRLERLKAARGSDGREALKRLANRLNIDPEHMLHVVKGYESEILPELGADGTITWPAFQFLHELLKRGDHSENCGQLLRD